MERAVRQVEAVLGCGGAVGGGRVEQEAAARVAGQRPHALLVPGEHQARYQPSARKSCVTIQYPAPSIYQCRYYLYPPEGSGPAALDPQEHLQLDALAAPALARPRPLLQGGVPDERGTFHAIGPGC